MLLLDLGDGWKIYGVGNTYPTAELYNDGCLIGWINEQGYRGSASAGYTPIENIEAFTKAWRVWQGLEDQKTQPNEDLARTLLDLKADLIKKGWKIEQSSVDVGPDEVMRMHNEGKIK